MLADGLAYMGARALVRATRDYAFLGAGTAALVSKAVPFGFLGGWQYAAALLLGLAVTDNYGRGDQRRDATRILTGVALGTGLSLWYVLWGQGVAAMAVQFSVTTLGIWAALVADRMLIDTLVTRFRLNGPQAERVVFVGEPGDPMGSRVHARLVKGRDMLPLGWITANGATGDNILGKTHEIWEVLNYAAPDTVVLCGQLPDDAFETVVSAAVAAGCRVLSVPRYEGLAELRPGMVFQRGLPMVELTVPSLKARQLLAKRVIDLVGAVVGLVVFSPVFALCALLIKLDSKGPVFFRQERVGHAGRPFRIIKFRSMVRGAEERRAALADESMYPDQRLFKMLNDPRITRVGFWLRRTSIDELPQLANVLLGEMSLVGPRPPLPEEVALYEEHHFCRFDMKPGITGPWQVAGRNRITDFEAIVKLEREYISTWSLLNDVRILLATVPVVLRMDGAH
jgi:exopolysaccharide biosynthesis polyprenyl glycosylphosphotransferase